MTDRTDPTDQENPMSKTDRHDELKALLSKISEESVSTSNVLADVLDLLRERLPEPHDSVGSQCRRNYCEETHDPAPADDLPGEPVEPGDLRAGDRVAFTWWGVEHSTCTLVSVAGGSILRADANDAGDRGIPYVVIRGGWAGGISDVRLIERAPREDDDSAFDNAMRTIATLEARTAKAEAERDEWKARHEALREDVETRWAFVDDNFLKDILHSILKGDDERAKGGQR